MNLIKKNLLFLLVIFFASLATAKAQANIGVINFHELPREAIETIYLIKREGPFPYQKDGIIFGNYESNLPKQKRGYYREFTVKTPRTKNRGARRIIVGGNIKVSTEYYYTDDHYESFRRIKD